MPIERPGHSDHPGEREPLRREGRDYWSTVVEHMNQRNDREHGLDDTFYRGWVRKGSEIGRGVPDLDEERFVQNRYNEASKAARDRVDAGDTSHDPREHPTDPRAVRLPREIHEAVRENLPDVPDRQTADRTYATAGDIFDENGKFLRREYSGGKNPDGRHDTRVEQAEQLARDHLGLPSRATFDASKHVETKTAVDAVSGELPKRLAIFLNNTECGPGPYSCRTFLDKVLRDNEESNDREITVYDYYGNVRVYPRPESEQGRP